MIGIDHAAEAPGEGHALLSLERWRRRIALWIGAIIVALASLAFAKACDAAYGLFRELLRHGSWYPLIVTPIGFALLSRLSRGRLRHTRGSGIPQVIAGLTRPRDLTFSRQLFNVPIAIGKLLLTSCALGVGASVGREGPSVHVGAAVMSAFARLFGFRDATAVSRFALAGGAAGIAAAFNTPLAGVVFAIEELAGAYEHRFSGALLTAVVIAGVVSLGLVGDYAYFGKLPAALPLGWSWLSVLVCGVAGGSAGGVFARVVGIAATGLPGVVGQLKEKTPAGFAAVCGLAMAALGLASGDAIYGTGYEQARDILSGAQSVTPWFGLAKFAANILSYAAGIPGGIFSPALAVGAGIGQNLASILPHTDATVVALLAMAAYLAGVTQAPLTAAVITLELTDDHALVLPIATACLLGRSFSTLFCPVPIYRTLASLLVDARIREAATEDDPPSDVIDPRTG